MPRYLRFFKTLNMSYGHEHLKLNISYGHELIICEISVYCHNIGFVQQLVEKLIFSLKGVKTRASEPL